MPGYPDFQTSAQWRGDALFSVSAQAIATGAGTVLLGATQVTNYAYLALIGAPNALHVVSVDVVQFDPGTSQETLTQTFYFNGASSYIVPVLLPQILDVRAHAQGAGTTWTGYLAATNVPRSGWASEGQAELLFATTAAIAAAGTAVVSIPTYVGPAKLMIDASQTAFTTRIRQYSLDGVTQIGRPFSDSEATKSVVTYDVWLPAGLNELRIGNNAGTSSTYTYALTAVSYFGVDG